MMARRKRHDRRRSVREFLGDLTEVAVELLLGWWR